ncbi:prolyl oligopeptidase family protein [Tumebacillus sp. BK434]|uniref:alpha/beta hydrolase family protein n=1 Tax=Tumebacillus sp. BK434 TaxID=2512169 RepID=UPI0010E5BC5A|nr:prolyl oligopeptidase family serine peptidase [Tumebacillus sp. BK434]TCP52187.1 prolyl oligopeptidase family protein [Tumebacillus sp. BK434]
MQRLASDGRMVSAHPVVVHPDFADRVEITKIFYLVDGLKVAGFIARPLLAGHNCPVLLYNRGGYRSFSKLNDAALVRVAEYAARGYVVLASQYRGNGGGEGRDEYGGADVKDLFVLAWLAESLPYADASQLFMFGHSRGGMMTYLCIRHGLPLRAAAVVAAPTDLARRPLPHAMEQLYGGLFGDPAANPEPYRERSALCWPERLLRVPLLIQHGGQDRRVYPEESLQLVEQLQAHGAEHKFILYPEGDHFLQNVHQARDREIFNWLGGYAR